jgi:hypothetical protein
MNVRIRCVAAIWVAMTIGIFAIAGEPIEGTVKMKLDIGGKFTREIPGQWYPAWRERVTKRFKRFASDGLNEVFTFIRTDLPVSTSRKIVRGAVYQCVEKPDAFFLPAEFTRVHFKKREVTGAWRDQLAISPDRSVIMIERFGPTLPYANYTFDGKTVEWMGDGYVAWPDWLRDEVVK